MELHSTQSSDSVPLTSFTQCCTSLIVSGFATPTFSSPLSAYLRMEPTEKEQIRKQYLGRACEEYISTEDAILEEYSKISSQLLDSVDDSSFTLIQHRVYPFLMIAIVWGAFEKVNSETQTQTPPVQSVQVQDVPISDENTEQSIQPTELEQDDDNTLSKSSQSPQEATASPQDVSHEPSSSYKIAVSHFVQWMEACCAHHTAHESLGFPHPKPSANVVLGVNDMVRTKREDEKRKKKEEKEKKAEEEKRKEENKIREQKERLRKKNDELLNRPKTEEPKKESGSEEKLTEKDKEEERRRRRTEEMARRFRDKEEKRKEEAKRSVQSELESTTRTSKTTTKSEKKNVPSFEERYRKELSAFLKRKERLEQGRAEKKEREEQERRDLQRKLFGKAPPPTDFDEEMKHRKSEESEDTEKKEATARPQREKAKHRDTRRPATNSYSQRAKLQQQNAEREQTQKEDGEGYSSQLVSVRGFDKIMARKEQLKKQKEEEEQRERMKQESWQKERKPTQFEPFQFELDQIRDSSQKSEKGEVVVRVDLEVKTGKTVQVVLRANDNINKRVEEIAQVWSLNSQAQAVLSDFFSQKLEEYWQAKEEQEASDEMSFTEDSHREMDESKDLPEEDAGSDPHDVTNGTNQDEADIDDSSRQFSSSARQDAELLGRLIASDSGSISSDSVSSNDQQTPPPQ
ncbi:hypothetical protein BLNAU_7621 [Blattamonas nauphoetae]|uniref:Uncharacterized protein n=1 Tax=Blattamonas nauphoetae TaxID=2049346 RepID=A0ABQ9Y158_9EUKA|nr:hypothetical protein BLNAU_7621 [Blattamonas nauphoetae]